MREPSPLKKHPRNARKHMCGGGDHLACKHPVSLEACKGCVPPKGTIVSARDPLTHPFYLIEPPQPYRLT